MFQVVEHVRDSHLIHEIGEDQESKDDLDYLVDGIAGEHSQKVKVYRFALFPVNLQIHIYNDS